MRERWRWVVLGAALTAAPAAASAQDAGVREIEVVVDGAYQPARIEVAPGERVRLRFVRHDYGGCTREVVFPSLDLRRELPTNVPVVVDLPPLPPGETAFQCGMGMVHGALVVRPAAPPAAPPAPPPRRRR